MSTRVKLTLSLPAEVSTRLTNLQTAFGHEEPEETIATLLGLGMVAVSVSSIDSPKIVLTNFEDRKLSVGYTLPTK